MVIRVVYQDAYAMWAAELASFYVAALQIGSKQSLKLQDKFVLWSSTVSRTIDSLASLYYDDKGKLTIGDGNINGSGNDHTTPQIVPCILIPSLILSRYSSSRLERVHKL
jgi:hypothetical protein